MLERYEAQGMKRNHNCIVEHRTGQRTGQETQLCPLSVIPDIITRYRLGSHTFTHFIG